MEIIGRERERQTLKRLEISEKPDFVAVYGRRRVGKTFLIVEHFDNKFAFSTTGVSGGGMNEQLRTFHASLKKYFKAYIPTPLSIAGTMLSIFVNASSRGCHMNCRIWTPLISSGKKLFFSGRQEQRNPYMLR